MYLVLIACQVLLLSVTSANPFHKYPYVFLLDIGNEELEKTNSEQIRVNVPGGSLALRYPGVGNGDTITHVRVSGIDFGTDLQANVVDGGPGSKYVVIVFAGNQGTPYDAVITIQTISDEDMIQTNIANLANNNKVEDGNDSSEDLSNDSTDLKASPGGESDFQSDSQSAGNTYAEIRQPGYSNYGYVNSEGDDGNTNGEIRQSSYNSYSSYKDSDDFEINNDEGTSDNDQPSNEDDQDEEGNDELDQEDNQAVEVNNKRGNIQDSQVEQQHSDFNDDYGNEDNDAPYNTDESSKYSKYQSIMPKLYDGVRIYPQNAVPFVMSNYNSEDPNEVDQTFNDEELHNNYKSKDSNNNFYDSDDASAVES